MGLSANRAKAGAAATLMPIRAGRSAWIVSLRSTEVKLTRMAHGVDHRYATHSSRSTTHLDKDVCPHSVGHCTRGTTAGRRVADLTPLLEPEDAIAPADLLHARGTLVIPLMHGVRPPVACAVCARHRAFHRGHVVGRHGCVGTRL